MTAQQSIVFVRDSDGHTLTASITGASVTFSGTDDMSTEAANYVLDPANGITHVDLDIPWRYRLPANDPVSAALAVARSLGYALDDTHPHSGHVRSRWQWFCNGGSDTPPEPGVVY